MGFIRDARKGKGYTEAQVGELAGITQQHYHFVETGQRKPSVDVAKRIAAVLGIDWTLFYEDEARTKEVGHGASRKDRRVPLL